MTSLIDTIRFDQLVARKKAMNSADLVLVPLEFQVAKLDAALLTTLLGEAERVGKDAGGRPPTDVEIVSVIRKFVKNIDETLKIRPSDTKAAVERQILVAYLPQPLSDDEVRLAIQEAFTPQDAIMKNMKTILAHLEANHPGRVTGQQVAAILKNS